MWDKINQSVDQKKGKYNRTKIQTEWQMMKRENRKRSIAKQEKDKGGSRKRYLP